MQERRSPANPALRLLSRRTRLVELAAVTSPSQVRRRLEQTMERTVIEPVTSGLQIRVEPRDKVSRKVACAHVSQIDEVCRSAPVAVGQHDLTRI
jgi:hypothetical protein